MSENKEPDFTKDEFWGKGGSYIVDPATGKRRPRTAADDAAAKEQPAGTEAAAAPARRVFGRGTNAPAGDENA